MLRVNDVDASAVLHARHVPNSMMRDGAVMKFQDGPVIDMYEATADALVVRILETFEAHPEAAELTDVWGILKVPGFKCDDLLPSLAQAGWAFSKAKRIWQKRKAGLRG